MGVDLLPLYPVFAQSIQRSAENMKDLEAKWDLIEELSKPESSSRLAEAEFAQSCCTALHCCTALQLALVDLLESWNVKPDVVCGHSSGEIAAAYASGALSALDAFVTLSGDVDALDEIKETLTVVGVFNRKLAVSVAYHSLHLKPVENDYLTAISSIVTREHKKAVRLVSSVIGREMSGTELGGKYWTRNLLCPVRFSDALKEAVALVGGGTLTLAQDSIAAEPSWRKYIRLSETPWLRGHVVNGNVVLAGACFVTAVVEAVRQKQVLAGGQNSEGVVHFRDVIFEKPLLVQDDDIGTEVVTLLRPYSSVQKESSKWLEFRIFSLSHGNDRLRALGLDYTGCFNAMVSASARPWESSCVVRVQDVASTVPSGYQQPHSLHPTTLKGCLQTSFVGYQAADSMHQAHVLAFIDELVVNIGTVLQPGQQLSVATKTRPYGLRQIASDLVAVSDEDDSTVLIRATGVKTCPVEGAEDISKSGQGEDEPRCYQIDWHLDPLLASTESLVRQCSKDLTAPVHAQLSRAESPSEPKPCPSEEKMIALGITGEVLVRFGRCLPDIFTRQPDSIALLLENNMLGRIYTKDENVKRCNV
ncbi:hypothetical protein CDD80_5181 [Ophiocordyceps camponoti-rufipedis]|uniref:PKS/mFAS DH domain-containing protein n=1 Tax=Ophiocordyceps camponoti-rufipedis TaxID=2004952 RepID=A0A2C5ZNV1_9HYPO|nr:hypothetical protein CDD80_5181 [Ophiocordyceps camponoti-rufipedis]